MLAHSGATAVVADGDLARGSDLEAGGRPPRRPGRRRRGGRDRHAAGRHAAGARLGRCHRRRPLALPGAARSRRPGRHPLHLGDDRPAQGRGGPPLQRVHDRRGRAQLDRRRLAARQPAVHLRRHRAGLHAHEARPAGHLPAPLRRRPLAARGRGGAPDGRLPRPGHGAPAHRPPALRRGRPVVACRCARSAARRWRPTSSSACRTRCPTPWCRTTTA